MARFRKKPVVIEAVQWTGENWADVWAFINSADGDMEKYACSPNGAVAIETAEGTMKASPGDWIIKGVKGELYPCKPDIFSETYDPVD